MQTAAMQQTTNEQINDWTDVFFSKGKNVGFMSILNLENPDQPRTSFFKHENLEQLIAETVGQPDRYISLNAFSRYSRKSEYVAQVRTIGIDCDQYKLGLTQNDVMQRVYYLVSEGQIPMPNLVLKSRGVQLFYSINDGASVKMLWLTKYVTKKITELLTDVGADFNAIDTSRVMRVPYSINSRNNSIVTPEILHNAAYTLDDLREYFPEVKRYRIKENHKKQTADVVPFRRLNATNNYSVVNANRVADIEKLIEIRNGNMTSCRNVALYAYCFHLSQTVSSYETLLKRAIRTFSEAYSTDKAQTRVLSEQEIERTAQSAYDAAMTFKEYLKDNGYKIRFAQGDGIIKPMKNANLIEKLGITVSEQEQLKSIVNESIAYGRKKERERVRIAEKRRADGVQTMDVYQQQRATGKAAKMQKLAELMANNPDATQQELAELLGVTRMTVNRYLKEMSA